MLSIERFGPVSVYVNGTKFWNYKGGIFEECNQTKNHYVLVVGYTKDAWIIKNSWGTVRWKGENGYIRLKKPGNTCGILDFMLMATI